MAVAESLRAEDNDGHRLVHRARRDTNASTVFGQKTAELEAAGAVPPCFEESLEEGSDTVPESTTEQDTSCAKEHLVGAFGESCFEAPRGQEETSIEVDVVGGLQSGPSFSPWQIRDAQGREAANAGVSLGEDDALGDFFAGVEKGVDFDAPVILEEAAKCQKHVIYDITFVR